MTLTLPRVCHMGLSGPDVLAYSRTYHQLGIRKRDQTRHYGMRMFGNTQHFQRDHSLKQTGTIGTATFDVLKKHFDPYSKWLVGQADQKYDITGRDLVVGTNLAMMRIASFPYEQVRKYPFTLAAMDENGSDCSGTFEFGFYVAHLHMPNILDPSGLKFDGYGYTGTLLEHGRRVTSPKPGDAAFFYPDYSHVGCYLGNGRIFSHGHPPTASDPSPHIIGTGGVTMWRSYLP